MSDKVELGALVRLASGGPQMVVAHRQEVEGRDVVAVGWYRGEGAFGQMIVAPEAVRPLPADEQPDPMLRAVPPVLGMVVRLASEGSPHMTVARIDELDVGVMVTCVAVLVAEDGTQSAIQLTTGPESLLLVTA